MENAKQGKKKVQEVDKGWDCDLTPKDLVLARFFAPEQAALEALREDLATKLVERDALEEEDNEAEPSILPLKQGKGAGDD